MTNSKRAGALCALALSGWAAAQAPDGARMIEIPGAVDTAAGLQLVDGELWGAGRDYKARFSARGMSFTPALGDAAPRNETLRLCGLSAGRGAAQRALAPAAPESAELTVRYDRGVCVERYDVRPEGAEQSFVFEALPPGTGDLVVRCACETDLPLAAAQPGGEPLSFVRAGVGGVSIGAVVGVDARGRRADGTARYADGVLELRLPAAFVDSAALPLVLDPIIRSLTIATGAADNRRPEPAWLPDVYLVAYQQKFSRTDIDIYARRVDPTTFTMFNGIIFVAIGFGVVEHSPSCGAVPLHDHFVVAWTQTTNNGDVGFRAVRASDGRVGGALVQASSAEEILVDVANAAPRRDNVLVTWVRNDAHIVAARAYVDATGNMRGEPVRVLSPVGNVSVGPPKISKNGGTEGHYLIAYRFDPTGDLLSGIQAVLVGSDLTIVDQSFVVHHGFTVNNAPDVDGDGLSWLVTWDSKPSVGPSPYDVRARNMTYNRLYGTLTAGFSQTLRETSRNEQWSHVARLGGSVLVSWMESDGTADFDSRVQSVTTVGYDCEGTVDLGTEVGRAEFSAQMAATYTASGEPGDHAIVVWERRNGVRNSDDGDIRAALWQAEDGVELDLGGASPSLRSVARAPCARVGNSRFTFELHNSLRNVPAYLVLSPDRLDWWLLLDGTLVPDPFTGWIVQGTTSTAGTALVQMPIPAVPALRDAALFVQWGMTRSGGTLGLSTAIQITIQ